MQPLIRHGPRILLALLIAAVPAALSAQADEPDRPNIVLIFPDNLGWGEVAASIISAIEKTIAAKTVTYDLERQMDGATLLSCSGFGEAIVSNM